MGITKAVFLSLVFLRSGKISLPYIQINKIKTKYFQNQLCEGKL